MEGMNTHHSAHSKPVCFQFFPLQRQNQTTVAKPDLEKTFVLGPATRDTNNVEAIHTYAADPDSIVANSTNCQSNTC